jgi:[protein-PII] uridylyltransferase
VADIRAVGPGIWNGWKGQLLRELYTRAEEFMLGGHPIEDREDRAAAVKEAVRERLADWPAEVAEAQLARGAPSFWLSADAANHERWARLMRKADEAGDEITVDARVHEFQSVTEVTVYTADHPGLFSRLAGAFTVCGASIADARIFTTTDGMALDVFWVQDLESRPIDRPDRIERLRRTVERILRGDLHAGVAVAERRSRLPGRASVFKVPPRVIIDNDASRTHTVIEVNGRDRPALLHDLTRAFFELSLQISNARIATYGERAVDVFYVKDLFGLKIDSESRQATIRDRLMLALDDRTETAAGQAAE